MKYLRTPDSQFENLDGYNFAPHYLNDLKGYNNLRLHYIDEGPQDANTTFLCLHGQPAWCYLYRKMIPVFVGSSARVVAPDLFGFGRSDKPVEEDVYTFNFHRNMLIEFIKALDLQNITLVCQDWGGILGLTIPQEMPDRFKRLIVMNTSIPVGKPAGKGFDAWREYNRSRPDLDISALFMRSTQDMTAQEAAAYDAPFPDATYKAGVRKFPELVMTDEGMEGVEIAKKAKVWWQESWSGQSFMAVGMQDPVLGPQIMAELRQTIKNCPPAMEVADGGHFVQEKGYLIAQAALASFAQRS